MSKIPIHNRHEFCDFLERKFWADDKTRRDVIATAIQNAIRKSGYMEAVESEEELERTYEMLYFLVYDLAPHISLRQLLGDQLFRQRTI